MRQEQAVSPQPRQERVGSRGITTVVLLCVASAAIALAVAAFALYRPVPPTLETAPIPTASPLVAEETVDSRSVELSVELGDEAALVTPADGRITATSCSVGETIKSGTSVITLDRVPLVNLHTSTPVWRDLDFGDKGADVEALQAELARLGYSVSVSKRFDWQTWVAWDVLVEKLGGDTDYGTFSVEQVVWLSEKSVTAATCPVRLGATVQAGASLVGLPTPLLSAAVKDYPTDLVPGERTLTVNDVPIALDQDGNVTADGLTALADTASFRRFLQGPDDAILSADLVLVEPLTVYPVPPAAVALGANGSGCVALAHGNPAPVTVVSSRLGRSYIAFLDGVPASDEVLLQPDRGLTCS